MYIDIPIVKTKENRMLLFWHLTGSHTEMSKFISFYVFVNHKPKGLLATIEVLQVHGLPHADPLQEYLSDLQISQQGLI